MFKFAAVIASGLAFSVNGKQNVRSNEAKIASLQQQIDAANAMIDEKTDFMHRLIEILRQEQDQLQDEDISTSDLATINAALKRVGREAESRRVRRARKWM